MARRKPLSQLSPAYRRRIESLERRGFTRAQARGHPEESPGTLGIRDAVALRDFLASTDEPSEVHIEGDRVHVRTTDSQGRSQDFVMNRRQYDQVRPKGRPRKGVKRPNVFEYRKRQRKVA